MPNWCFNNLVVSGPAKAVLEFKKQARLQNATKDEASDFSFEQLIPTPSQLMKQQPGSGLANLQQAPANPADDDWYGWRVRNWGTKWDPQFELVKETKGQLVFHGESAWSPPLPGLLKVSEQFPALTFSCSYEEPGMCFRGEYECKAGQVLRDEYEEDYEPEEEEE